MKVSALLRIIPRAALDGPRRDGKSVVSIALLVFVSCNLALMLTTLWRPTPSVVDFTSQVATPLSEKPIPAIQNGGRRFEVEPVSFILSRLSTAAMAYLSAAAYVGKHQMLDEMLSRIERTWKRPAVTLLHLELLATASSSLFLTLSAFTRITEGVVMEALLIAASVGLVVCLGPVLFAHSDIACKLSLVVSIVEEDCKGVDALERAGELVRGRRLQGFVLTTLLALLEQAPFMVFGFDRSQEWKNLEVVLVHLTVKFLAYFAYTVFYYECKKRHGNGKSAD